MNILNGIIIRGIAIANGAVVALMMITGYAYFFSPINHPLLSATGVLFPIFLALNILFLVFWALVKLKYCSIPILGLVLCYVPTHQYVPLNIQSNAPEGSLKVLSYNIQSFGYEPEDETRDEQNPIVQYIANSDADIVCLQEAPKWRIENEVASTLSPIYPYQSEVAHETSGDVLALYSKYPIISTERIPFDSEINLSVAYRIKVDNDTILVVNNHLESNKMTKADKAGFKNMVKGNISNSGTKQESSLLLNKLALAAQKRAVQVKAVVSVLKKYENLPQIVCGDFNEWPNGYALNTLQKTLTNSFVETGNGAGWSYHRSGMYVRIDNILCSKQFKPYKAKVDSDIKTSDHYPIYCYLERIKEH